MQRQARQLVDLPLPDDCRDGTYVTPAVYAARRCRPPQGGGVRPDPARRAFSRRPSRQGDRRHQRHGYGLTLGLHSRIAAVAQISSPSGRGSATSTSTATRSAPSWACSRSAARACRARDPRPAARNYLAALRHRARAQHRHHGHRRQRGLARDRGRLAYRQRAAELGHGRQTEGAPCRPRAATPAVRHGRDEAAAKWAISMRLRHPGEHHPTPNWPLSRGSGTRRWRPPRSVRQAPGARRRAKTSSYKP